VANDKNFKVKEGLDVGGIITATGGTLTGNLDGTSADFSSSVEANNFTITGGAFIARMPGNVDGSLWLASDAPGTTSANGVTLAGGTSPYSYHNSDGINIKQGGLLIDDVEVINASRIINAKSLYLNGTGGGRVPHPEGATYFTGVNEHTGACKIKLPTASKGKSDMISFEVSIYDYAANESVKLLINAYQYSDVNWNNHTVVTLAGKRVKTMLSASVVMLQVIVFGLGSLQVHGTFRKYLSITLNVDLLQLLQIMQTAGKFHLKALLIPYKIQLVRVYL